MFDCIVIGAGFAGSVIAREFAEKQNKKVLILEKRNHIAGNMFDCYDKSNILIHQYGPHIFHTKLKKVYDYLSKFTKWNFYQHEVSCLIDNKYIPIPFNLNSLSEAFGCYQSVDLKEKLIEKYGFNKNIPILKLLEDEDMNIRKIAEFVYSKIFVNYTMKQWELKPNEIDPDVTARVPVSVSYDNRYFTDLYQGLPLYGYTELFKNMLSHENITLELNMDAKNRLSFDFENKQILFDNEIFNKPVIYSGPIDELLDYKFGTLPYRSLEFEYETHQMNYYQPKGTINYPNHELFTRITEFKHMTQQIVPNVTTIIKEYPYKYDRKASKGNIPFYPIIKKENNVMYNKYAEEIKIFSNLYLLGRLAEYKYYNMDAIVNSALNLFDKISK